MTFDSAALIGHTGFVGGNLARQHAFDDFFNSANIEQIAGRAFDLIVCAGVPAEKWKANAEPERDRLNITRLMSALERTEASRVVLISTVDVFADPAGVDEASPVPTESLQPYGRNRRHLEEFVAARFDATIVRLPGLYGPGLKKNAIYDLLHDKDTHKIDSRAVFQFYGVGRLWRDLEVALEYDLGVVHLATPPVSVAAIARTAFALDFTNEVAAKPARYDMRTRYAALFGGGGPHTREYIQTRDEELEDIAAFVVAERGRGAHV